ncbi:MAG: FAD-dependent oxidoreductase [Gemmataceae bacterium]
MGRSEPPRMAILGAGPVGLEAALHASKAGFLFRVYERGKIGENPRHWGHVRLFTPLGMNVSPLGRAALQGMNPREPLPGDQEILTGREYVARYLEPLAQSPALASQIETGVTVLAVGRKGMLQEELLPDAKRAGHPFRLLLRGADGKERVEEADIVLDCTGTYPHGRFLGDGGIPAAGELSARGQILCGLEDILGEKASHFADRTTLVIGGGFSAATSVVLLAQLAKKHPSSWIVWLARRSGSQPVRRVMNDALRERDLLAARANSLATRGEGHVEFHPGTWVESVEQEKDGLTVHARVGSTLRRWTVDRIIANVGYQPDRRLLSELPDNEPNYFVLGMKSLGRSSNFLLQEGFAQVREVFSQLTGKPETSYHRAGR